MNRRNRWTQGGRWPRRLAIAAAAGIVAGCAFFDPYVGMPAAPPEGWDKVGVRFAGDADREIARVEAVRQDYLSRMQQMGRTKATIATGATLLSGWALYNALKPNEPAVTETPIGDKRRTVRLGATIATAYGLSEYALNKEQESAYNVGYQYLTCLLRQSAPLLMPADPIRGSNETRPDSVVDLRKALDTLSLGILDLNQFVASAKIGQAEGSAAMVQSVAEEASALIAANSALPDKAAKGQVVKKLSPEELSAAIGKLKVKPPPGVVNRAGLDQTLKDAEKALAYARNALADGEALLKAVGGSGREIGERAHAIVATVNDLVRKAQPDLKAADASLSKAQDIASGFLKIGVETAKDQAESNGGASTNTSALPPDLRGTTVAAAPPMLRFPALGGAGVSLFGGSLAAVMLAEAAAGAAVKSPEPAVSGVQKPADDLKKKEAPQPARPAKPKAAPATLTVDELQKLSDAMEATLKQARQRQADEAQAKLVGGYVSKLDELTKLKDACVGRQHALRDSRMTMVDRCDADELARMVEDVYAARRPVVATVLHFRSQAKAVRRVTGCPSEQGVQVTPNETVIAHAGDSVSFVVTQPGAGVPVAMLQGAQGDDLATLKTDSLGTAGLKAGIKFGDKAKGRYTLLATNSTGEFSESVLIVVKAAPADDKKKNDDTADKPKPAASAAGNP